MSISPTVAVVIPAYNHAPYVRRSILSVLEQDVELELVVIDDGSSDETWQEIEKTRATATRSFQAIRQTNAGVCKTVNRGIRSTTAPLLAILASDDYFLPGKLRKQVDLFRTGGPRLGLVHTSGYLDYQEGQLEDMTGGYRPAVGLCYEQVLTQEVRILAPSMMIARTAYEEIGGFDEELGAEDVDLFLRLAAAGYEFAYIPEPLVVKTVVPGSAGSNLRGLIEVHEQILAKQRPRLTEQRYRELRRLMYEHLVLLASGAGQYRYAATTAIDLTLEHRSLWPVVKFGVWGTRAAVLRSMPRSIRHAMRLARSRIRTSLRRRGGH